jgi:hypothetical protein
MIRPALEFSRLERAGRRGFTLVGSGMAIVTTPRRFPGPRSTIPLRLGPGNPQQQYRPGATTRVYRVHVRL